MKRVTDRQYYDVTNCTPDFRIANFTLDEVQDFLNGLGYDIIEHSAKGMVQDRQSNPGGDVEKIGSPYLANVKDILAIKPGTIIPENLSTPEGIELRIGNVFQRELRKRMLYGA